MTVAGKPKSATELARNSHFTCWPPCCPVAQLPPSWLTCQWRSAGIFGPPKKQVEDSLGLCALCTCEYLCAGTKMAWSRAAVCLWTFSTLPLLTVPPCCYPHPSRRNVMIVENFHLVASLPGWATMWMARSPCYTARKIPFMFCFSGNFAASVLISTFMCRLIYSQDWFTFFPAAEPADRSWKYINLSQIYECRN